MRHLTTLGLVLAGSIASAQQGPAPMSAIDWLSDSLSEESTGPATGGPVAGRFGTEPITVAPLDAVSPDGVGLLSRAVTGLPANLWGTSETATLARMIAGFPVEPLPAVQEQFRRLMLAELDPPGDTSPDAKLLQARLDALLARGAVEEAEALLERADSDAPEMFRRAFDVGLLTGREQAACAHMRAVPGLSPSFPVRIFCLARTGDWPAAALTLESAKALGQLTPAEDALLLQFLDPEFADLAPLTAPPAHPSPLTFRMLEAIGTPLPTAQLPLAFAHSDLRPTAGWKARVEAAERLARAGALPADVLLAIYGERRPAASGSVWDRVAAVQALERALTSGDEGEIAATLPPAMQAMASVGLTLPLARGIADRLPPAPADPALAAQILRIGLLSDGYEAVAQDSGGEGVEPETDFLLGIARGAAVAVPDDMLAQAIAAAFADPPPAVPEPLLRQAQEQRLGEALLSALKTLARGRESDPGDLTGALAFLRSIGLEDTARKAALQILLLEPIA